MKLNGVWEDNNSSEDIIDLYEHCLVDVTTSGLAITSSDDWAFTPPLLYLALPLTDFGSHLRSVQLAVV